MRSFIQYIREEYNKIQLKEVVVKFAVKDNDIVVEIPESFMEDQLNTYLDDTIINKTFVGDDYTNELFGKNADYISDVYFEYSGLSETSLSTTIEWSSDYNTNAETDANDLKKMKLSNFKFVVSFNKFELLDDKTDDESIQGALYTVFNRCVSDEFKWPVPFILNEEDIEFKK